jgi:hypothetical protein
MEAIATLPSSNAFRLQKVIRRAGGVKQAVSLVERVISPVNLTSIASG